MYLLMNKNFVLPFSSGRRYPVGTGYIALYDEGGEETVCCLCRILDREEIRLYQAEKNLSSVCTLDNREGENSEVISVIVLCQVNGVEEADKVVESYRRGLEALEQFRSD